MPKVSNIEELQSVLREGRETLHQLESFLSNLSDIDYVFKHLNTSDPSIAGMMNFAEAAASDGLKEKIRNLYLKQFKTNISEMTGIEVTVEHSGFLLFPNKLTLKYREKEIMEIDFKDHTFDFVFYNTRESVKPLYELKKIIEEFETNRLYRRPMSVEEISTLHEKIDEVTELKGAAVIIFDAVSKYLRNFGYLTTEEKTKKPEEVC